MQPGDLVTVDGIPGVLNMGADHHFGLVTEMYQDDEKRWIARIKWFKHPDRAVRGEGVQGGIYYNYRYPVAPNGSQRRRCEREPTDANATAKRVLFGVS